MADNKVPQSRISGLSESLDAADELFEYDSRATFPAQGKAGKIYVDKLNNLLYRWDDTTSDYVEVSAAGSSSGSNVVLPSLSYGASAYFPIEPDTSAWIKADGNFITDEEYYSWLEKIQSGELTVNGASVKLSTETYTDYDFVLNTTDKTFRLPLLNGSETIPSSTFENLELEATGAGYTSPYNAYVYVNKTAGTSGAYISLSTPYGTEGNVAYSSAQNISAIAFVGKNEYFSVWYSASGATQAFRLYKCVGNGSLYYYTGATENTLSEDVEELKSQVGDISAILDNINGEVL